MKKILMVFLSVLMLTFTFGFTGSAQPAQAAVVLKVATDANYPPFDFYQGQLKIHTGFDIELIQAMAPLMGYDKVEFVNVAFDSILKGLNENQYDLAVAGITITEERKKIVDFSDPYIDAGLRICIPVNAQGGEGMTYMRGKTVAAEAGSHVIDVAKAAGAAEVIEVRDVEDAIKMAAHGMVDCAVADGPVLAFFMNNGYGDMVKFAGEKDVESYEMGIAVAKGDIVLLTKVNDALHQLRRSGKFKQIAASYFGTEEHKH